MTNNSLISQIEKEQKMKKVAKIVAAITLAVAVILFVVRATATDTPENPPQPPIDEGMSIEEMMAMIRARRASHKPTTTSSTLTGKDGQTSGGWDAPIDVATPGKYQAGSIGNTEETKHVVVKGEAPTENDPVEEVTVRNGHFVRFHSNSGQFEISYQDVVKVLVDGIELSRSEWTIKSNGNLEIELKNYDTNTHILKVWWDDGSASCEFMGKKAISLQAEEASESTDNGAANDSTSSEEVSNENSEGSADNTSGSSDTSGNSSTTSEESGTGNETSNETSEDNSGENSNDPIENGHVEYDPGF